MKSLAFGKDFHWFRLTEHKYFIKGIPRYMPLDEYSDVQISTYIGKSVSRNPNSEQKLSTSNHDGQQDVDEKKCRANSVTV